jgi:hypothetical protein
MYLAATYVCLGIRVDQGRRSAVWLGLMLLTAEAAT